MTENLSRREMLEVTAAALATPLLKVGGEGAVVPIPPTKAPPVFFSQAEYALVDELSELIIPADAQSPGARAAQVAAYIDSRLAESLEPERQASWHTGLQAVDALAKELHGKTFMEGTPEQRVAVLTRMAAGEADPKTPAERFFGEVKGSTIHAYYTSKIGIQVDQEYKGNVYQNGEYAGYDPT